MVSVDLSGSWKLVSSENLDKFLKACGVGLVHRTMACKVNPTVDIKQDGGDTFEIATRTPLNKQEMRFKVDEVFKGNIPWEKSDREMKASWEDEKLVIRMMDDVDGSEPVFARYIDGEQLVLAQSKKGVESKRYFQRITQTKERN
ncbi:myelin P2 protein [Strongylocentrotus purpuratus]|uniref:Lipocalin/cytosolic fatty-acid binding domain-containing protein n=1 Tax=Strongylocentrotus purpuratus TaxID=7668 RepID=A0A7M7GIX2_STRPU|nr:myelin P2 protein [Strongylocentrotus purpuratus]